MTEFAFRVFFYGCIALICLWHLVIHPILFFWEQHLIDRENEAEHQLRKDYSDALHQETGRELRKLLTPEQFKLVEHHYL